MNKGIHMKNVIMKTSQIWKKNDLNAERIRRSYKDKAQV